MPKYFQKRGQEAAKEISRVLIFIQFRGFLA